MPAGGGGTPRFAHAAAIAASIRLMAPRHVSRVERCGAVTHDANRPEKSWTPRMAKMSMKSTCVRVRVRWETS